MSTLNVTTTTTDTLTGQSVGGSVAVTAEGGSTTTNLQQGLTKAWGNYDYDGTQAFADSFNFSGITDGGTGIAALTYTNNMGNANYASITNNVLDTGSYAGTNMLDHDSTISTSVVSTRGQHDVSSLTDIELAGIDIKGDLA